MNSRYAYWTPLSLFLLCAFYAQSARRSDFDQPHENKKITRAHLRTPPTANLHSSLGKTSYQGYDGSAYQVGAQIEAKASQDPRPNAIATDLIFSTRTLQGHLQEHMRLTANGSLLIGSPTLPGPVTITATEGAGLAIGIYKYCITYITLSGETAPGPVTTAPSTSNGLQRLTVTIPTAHQQVYAIKLYRTPVNSDQPFRLVTTLDNKTEYSHITFVDTIADYALGTALTHGQVRVTGNLLVNTQLKARFFLTKETSYTLGSPLPFQAKVDPHKNAHLSPYAQYQVPIDGWYYVTVRIKSKNVFPSSGAIGSIRVYNLLTQETLLANTHPVISGQHIDATLSGILVVPDTTFLAAAYMLYGPNGPIAEPLLLAPGYNQTSFTVHYLSSGYITTVPPLSLATLLAQETSPPSLSPVSPQLGPTTILPESPLSGSSSGSSEDLDASFIGPDHPEDDFFLNQLPPPQ